MKRKRYPPNSVQSESTGLPIPATPEEVIAWARGRVLRLSVSTRSGAELIRTYKTIIAYWESKMADEKPCRRLVERKQEGSVDLYTPNGSPHGRLVDCKDGWDYDQCIDGKGRWKYVDTFPSQDAARDAAEFDYADAHELPRTSPPPQEGNDEE
jgi:hypothetical protein